MSGYNCTRVIGFLDARLQPWRYYIRIRRTSDMKTIDNLAVGPKFPPSWEYSLLQENRNISNYRWDHTDTHQSRRANGLPADKMFSNALVSDRPECRTTQHIMPIIAYLHNSISGNKAPVYPTCVFRVQAKIWLAIFVLSAVNELNAVAKKPKNSFPQGMGHHDPIYSRCHSHRDQVADYSMLPSSNSSSSSSITTLCVRMTHSWLWSFFFAIQSMPSHVTDLLRHPSCYLLSFHPEVSWMFSILAYR